MTTNIELVFFHEDENCKKIQEQLYINIILKIILYSQAYGIIVSDIDINRLIYENNTRDNYYTLEISIINIDTSVSIKHIENEILYLLLINDIKNFIINNNLEDILKIGNPTNIELLINMNIKE
jgi:hypothetical protein